MNVLSLFDGMSCGRIALERAGIHVNNYFSSEIDKHALKVADANWPCDIANRLGDVTKIDASKLPKIDLLIGGSPCQGFSFAGKQLNFEDPRSKLFFEFVRLLKECKPKYFMLENVGMKQEYQVVITQTLGVEPIEINSNLVSAQNRKRLYWTNITVSKPCDKSILLKDVVGFESEIPKENEVIEAVEKFTTRKFAVSISKNGKIRPHRFDAKKSGISEIGTLASPMGKSVAIIASHAPKTYKSCPFLIYELNRNECEDLQNVPKGYTDSVSERQAKKMLGNGWTVDVIAHILKGVKKR